MSPRNCVAHGPIIICVKSRTRTPSSAMPLIAGASFIGPSRSRWMLPARPNRLLLTAALGAVAIPALALAQQSLLPPTFNDTAPAPEQTNTQINGQAPDSSAREATQQRSAPAEGSAVVETES